MGSDEAPFSSSSKSDSFVYIPFVFNGVATFYSSYYFLPFDYSSIPQVYCYFNYTVVSAVSSKSELNIFEFDFLI